MSEIKSVRIDNPFLWKRYRLQKQGILDVALILNDNTRIDVELQMRFQDYWKKRNLFYLAKLYTDDLKAGDNYKRLRKCIIISILGFRLIENEKYHNYIPYAIRMVNNLQMIKTKNVGIIQAMEVVREMSLSRRLRLTYEAHLKAVRDRKAEDEYIMRISEERGEARGEAKGEARGKAETLLIILESKGKVSEELRNRILAESNSEKLDAWVKRALSCSDIQDYRKALDTSEPGVNTVE